MSDIDEPLPVLPAQTRLLAALLKDALLEGEDVEYLAMLAEEFHLRHPPFVWNPYPASVKP